MFPSFFDNNPRDPLGRDPFFQEVLSSFLQSPITSRQPPRGPYQPEASYWQGGYRTTGPIIEELDDPPVPEARKQPPVIVEYHSDGEDDSPPSRNTARRDGAKRGSRGQVSSEGAKVAAGAAPCERQPMLARKQSGKTSGGGAGNAGLSGAATTVDARSGVAAHRETGASHNYSMKGAQARQETLWRRMWRQVTTPFRWCLDQCCQA